MVAPAGQVGIQVSRENFAMRRLGRAERASDSMRRHWAALLRCAEAVCLRVERWGLSGGGDLRCGAFSRSYLRRQLWRWEKMAAMVRPAPFCPGGWARH